MHVASTFDPEKEIKRLRLELEIALAEKFDLGEEFKRLEAEIARLKRDNQEEDIELSANEVVWMMGKPTKFFLGTRVKKIRGSNWHGCVVGFYTTELTPLGYCVESAYEGGSVQLYPESALEAWEAEHE